MIPRTGTEAIIHEASNGGYGGVVATLTVTEADNDPLGFVFAQSDGTALSSLSVPESGTAVYQVKLGEPALGEHGCDSTGLRGQH